MLKGSIKKLFLVTVLATNFSSLAYDSSPANSQKTYDILEKMSNIYGGKQAIKEVDKILIDSDYSINYRTQGYGYEGTDYHSNRPGNSYTLISYADKLVWTKTRRTYMDSLTGYTSLFTNGKTTNYNDITREYSVSAKNNFNKKIESYILRNPLLIIKDILSRTNELSYSGSERNYEKLAINMPSGGLLTLFANKSNYQIDKAELLLGGRKIEYIYSDFRTTGQFKLPFSIKINQADNYYSAYTLRHVSSYNFEPNIKQTAVTPKGYSPEEKHDTYDGKLRAQSIGKGIHWFNQRGANSLFIEFSDYVMAIDANNGSKGSFEQRLSKFREIVPSKPIKFVSISHQHHDHFDRVPFYVKNGAKVITAEEFIPLLTKRIEQVNTANAPTPEFEIVTQKRTFRDAAQHVEIYELKNMLHAETMLMTYFPDEQLVYLPDHYEEMYLIENRQAIKTLMTEIKRLGLRVKGFIQGHGNDVYSAEQIEAALQFPIEVKELRRTPHHSVTRAEK